MEKAQTPTICTILRDSENEISCWTKESCSIDPKVEKRARVNPRVSVTAISNGRTSFYPITIVKKVRNIFKDTIVEEKATFLEVVWNEDKLCRSLRTCRSLKQ